MSNFPGNGTLKQRNIPAAALELLQRAYDSRSAAPEGVNITLNYGQNIATGNIQIPCRVGFFGAGRFQIIPKFLYSGETQDLPLQDWVLDFVDFDGNVFAVSYSGALIAMVSILNEAERRGGSAQNIGVTAANFNDETQVFSCQFSLPIDMAVRSNGEVYAKSIDYVGNVNFADLIELPLPAEVEDDARTQPSRP